VADDALELAVSGSGFGHFHLDFPFVIK
jgi:hypothetical protein